MRNRNGMYADVSIHDVVVRIFKPTPKSGYPTIRLTEFERAMVEHDPTQPSIICGDFNILEKPHITPLNWLLGGKISDALLYRRERTTIEQHFVAHELTITTR